MKPDAAAYAACGVALYILCTLTFAALRGVFRSMS